MLLFYDHFYMLYTTYPFFFCTLHNITIRYGVKSICVLCIRNVCGIWMDMALAVYITSPFTTLPSHKRGNSGRYIFG